MSVHKYSRQRECVMQFLSGRTDHPTADIVYDNVRKEFPNISLGTVYRNLNLLTEMGRISKIPGIGGADHFDPRTDAHCHFICSRCHRIYDMDSLDIGPVLEEAEKKCPGRIEAFSGTFTGICTDCA